MSGKIPRRDLLRAAAVLPVLGFVHTVHGPYVSAAGSTDIRIEDVSFAYQDFLYRTPYQFGGRTVDRVTLLNVNCLVQLGAGRKARGFGSMPLGNLWAFPSDVMSYDTTLGAMKALAERIAKVTAAYNEPGHPVDINRALEPAYLAAARGVSKALKLAEPIPKLCTLVTASPFDAAIHDAYGKVQGLNCYHTYGRQCLKHDLSRDLGLDFKGDYLSHFILKEPKPRVAVFHSIGAADPLTDADVKKRLSDGLPETLPGWINYNGLTHFKIKLNGGDLEADLDRVLRIDSIVTATEQQRGVKDWLYSLDFNERCPNVGYLLEFLHRLKEQAPGGFDRIQYLEQPTARDLKAHRSNTMHEAAKLRPVVIDESLTDLESLLLAREMGYTGVALKACKGQSQAMLMAAAAQKFGMFRTVQDLTCPGASLIQSVGIAAHVPGVTAIEANAREYVPAANKPWESKFPGLFHITDGNIKAAGLTGPGLGAVKES
jgi:L-alanine-DL-glutamate epimerase-like enolase superfamily enzyme